MGVAGTWNSATTAAKEENKEKKSSAINHKENDRWELLTFTRNTMWWEGWEIVYQHIVFLLYGKYIMNDQNTKH